MSFYYKNFIFLLSLILFFCLVYISVFNVYQTDDYILAYTSRKFGGSVNALFSLYNHWSGRYFSFFLALNNTLLYSHSQLVPKVFPPLLMVLFLSSVALNFNLYFNIKKWELLKKSFVFLFLYIVSLTSLSENIFWFTGSLIYFLPIVLSFFILYFIGIYYKKGKKIWGITSVFLIIIAVGCNEIASIFLLMSFLIFAYFKKDKFSKILFLVSLISFCVLFFAPGNFQRLSGSGNNISYVYLKYIGVGVANGVFIILKTSVIAPLFIFYFKNELNHITQKFEKKQTLFLLIISLAVLAFMGRVLLISERALDNCLFFSLIFICININDYIQKIPLYLLLLSVVLYFFPPFLLPPQKYIYFRMNFNVYNIAKDAFVNHLKAYKAEMKNRQQILESSSEKNIYLDPIIHKPSVLYFEEIGTIDNKSYVNDELEKFYNKKNIVLKK